MGAIALALLAGCTPKPPATLAEVADLVAASDWDGAESAVKSITRKAKGCELAKGHALASGLQAAMVLPAILNPNAEDPANQEEYEDLIKDGMKAYFFAAYEDAIAQVNKMSDCNIRSLSNAELEIGG